MERHARVQHVKGGSTVSISPVQLFTSSMRNGSVFGGEFVIGGCVALIADDSGAQVSPEGDAGRVCETMSLLLLRCVALELALCSLFKEKRCEGQSPTSVLGSVSSIFRRAHQHSTPRQFTQDARKPLSRADSGICSALANLNRAQAPKLPSSAPSPKCCGTLISKW